MFCVYLTKYSGKKLPPYYLGSSSIRRIAAGYLGSVSSKKWKQAWLEETRNNRHLFTVEILSQHATREEALTEELRLQLELDVVKDERYANSALARRKFWYEHGPEVGEKVRRGMAQMTAEEKARMLETRKKNIKKRAKQRQQQINENIKAGLQSLSEDKKLLRKQRWLESMNSRSDEQKRITAEKLRSVHENMTPAQRKQRAAKRRETAKRKKQCSSQ